MSDLISIIQNFFFFLFSFNSHRVHVREYMIDWFASFFFFRSKVFNACFCKYSF